MATTIKQRIELDGGKELKRELEEFGAAGRKAFRDLQKAAAETKGLSPGFFNSLKQAEVQLKSLGKAFDDVGKRLISTGTTLSAAVTAPIVGIGVAAVKSFGDFEASMANVSTLVDTSTESLKAMQEQVLAIGSRVPVSLSDLTEGLYNIRSAGISAGDAMGVLEGSARLAVAGLGSTKEAVDVATSAINAFGLKGKEQQRVFGLFFDTVKAGKTTISELAQGFGSVAGTIAQAKVPLDELLASVAALTTSGLPAAQAYSQLRAAVAGLIRDSTDLDKVWKRLGVTSFSQLVQRSGGMVEAFAKIRAAVGGDDAALIKLVGSVEGYNAIVALTGRQNKSFTDTLATMRSGADLLGEAFDKQTSTINAQFQLLANQLKEVSIQFGEVLLPSVKLVVEALSAAAKSIGDLSSSSKGWVSALAGMAAAIGPVLIALGLLGRTAGFILGGIGTLIAGIRALSAALLFVSANPIIAALALVGVTIGIWATRTSEATAALRVHQDLIGKVGDAYDQAGRKVAEMSQQVKDAALIQARLSQDAANKGLSSAIDDAINSIQQFDGLLPHAADQLFDVFKQFQATKDVEAFREEVAKIGAANPELGKLAQQFLDITENAHKLTTDAQESANFIGLLTGKLTDSEFAAKQAALGIAGYSDDAKKASEGVKQLGAATDDTKAKVEGLSHTIQVFRGGGADGKLSSETFNVINGVAQAAVTSKSALDAVGTSAKAAGDKVKQVSDDIASHIRTVPDSLKTDSIKPAVDGVVNDLGRIKPAADAAGTSIKEALTVDTGVGAGLAVNVDTAVTGVVTSIQKLGPAATDAVGGLKDALDQTDVGGGLSADVSTTVDGVITELDKMPPAASQAAAGVAQPFQALPAVFSGIFSGLGALIQGGFGNLSSVISSLAGQIRNEINSIISALREAVAQAQALRAQASGGGGGGSQGGFAEGGHLSTGRGTSTSDSIPIWASLGEFITKAKAVAYYGPGLFHALNNMALPKDFWKSLRGFKVGGVVDNFNRSMSVQRFASGGTVKAPLAAGGGFTGKTVKVQWQYGPSMQDVLDLIGENDPVVRFQQYALRSATTSAGKRPR